jgi:hypothetical protein
MNNLRSPNFSPGAIYVNKPLNCERLYVLSRRQTDAAPKSCRFDELSRTCHSCIVVAMYSPFFPSYLLLLEEQRFLVSCINSGSILCSTVSGKCPSEGGWRRPHNFILRCTVAIYLLTSFLPSCHLRATIPCIAYLPQLAYQEGRLVSKR